MTELNRTKANPWLSRLSTSWLMAITRSWLLCMVPLFSPYAWGEAFAPSSGNYDQDLGQLFGVILGARQYKEICNESFPESVQSNEDAYQKWRKHYLSFISEIEEQYSKNVSRHVKTNPRKPTEYPSYWASLADSNKEYLRKGFSRYGLEGFRNICRGYPAFLSAAQTDLEHCCAKQFLTIRRGPQKE